LDSGAALRTFCYVSDAIEMMWFVLLYGKSPLYNIGGINEISIRALALTIGRLLNVNVNFPELNVGVSGAPQNSKLNIEKHINEFNKSNFINLENGLKKTIKWIQSLKDADNEKGI
jgi:nucleoside-diphosphate-sugar epimerase